jgi:O-antigen/teichoic acid export membrane protein
MLNRKRTFLLGFSANNFYIVVTSLVGILSIPLGVKYFGITRFGVWALISTVVAYLEASNLGVTTAAAALIAKSSGAPEKSAVIRRSFVLLTVLSSLTLAVFYLVSINFPNLWDAIVKIPPSVKGEAIDTLHVTATLFLINLPLTIFYSGFVGSQQVHWERFYRVLNSIAGLIALLAVVIMKGSLVTMSVIRGVMILSVSLVAMGHFCFSCLTQKGWADGHVCTNEEFSTRSILTSGLRFFSIGIASMLILSADNIIIGKFISVDAVTRYFVTFKPYGIACAFITTANAALWPMYGKAASQDDWAWIQKTYNGFLQLLPTLAGLVWIGGVLFSRDIISIWVNPESYAGTFVAFCLGGYCYVLSIVNTSSQFLAGMNYTKKLVCLAWVEFIVTVGLTIVLVKMIQLNGVALAKCLSPALTVLWILPIAVYLKTEKKIKADCSIIIRHFSTVVLPLLLVSVAVTVTSIDKTVYRYPIALLILMVYVILTWNITKRLNVSYLLFIRSIMPRRV